MTTIHSQANDIRVQQAMHTLRKAGVRMDFLPGHSLASDEVLRLIAKEGFMQVLVDLERNDPVAALKAAQLGTPFNPANIQFKGMCGAPCKDGTRCRNRAGSNLRCHLHGGPESEALAQLEQVMMHGDITGIDLPAMHRQIFDTKVLYGGRPVSLATKLSDPRISNGSAVYAPKYFNERDAAMQKQHPSVKVPPSGRDHSARRTSRVPEGSSPRKPAQVLRPVDTFPDDASQYSAASSQSAMSMRSRSSTGSKSGRRSSAPEQIVVDGVVIGKNSMVRVTKGTYAGATVRVVGFTSKMVYVVGEHEGREIDARIQQTSIELAVPNAPRMPRRHVARTPVQGDFSSGVDADVSAWLGSESVMGDDWQTDMRSGVDPVAARAGQQFADTVLDPDTLAMYDDLGDSVSQVGAEDFRAVPDQPETVHAAQDAAAPGLLAVDQPVAIISGTHAGKTGTIIKVTSKRYKIRLDDGTETYLKFAACVAPTAVDAQPFDTPATASAPAAERLSDGVVVDESIPNGATHIVTSGKYTGYYCTVTRETPHQKEINVFMDDNTMLKTRLAHERVAQLTFIDAAAHADDNASSVVSNAFSTASRGSARLSATASAVSRTSHSSRASQPATVITGAASGSQSVRITKGKYANETGVISAVSGTGKSVKVTLDSTGQQTAGWLSKDICVSV